MGVCGPDEAGGEGGGGGALAALEVGGGQDAVVVAGEEGEGQEVRVGVQQPPCALHFRDGGGPLKRVRPQSCKTTERRGTKPWSGLPSNPSASQRHAGAERPQREGHEWSSIQPHCFTVARRGKKDHRKRGTSGLPPNPSASQWHAVAGRPEREGHAREKTTERGARVVFHPTPLLHSGTQGQKDHRERGKSGLSSNPSASQWHAREKTTQRGGHEALQWSFNPSASHAQTLISTWRETILKS